MNTPAPPSPVAACIGNSPLVKAGGAMIIPLLMRADLQQLQCEFSALRERGTLADKADANDSVRGDPERRLMNVEAGAVLDELYTSTGLAELLRSLTGITWRPLGTHASYSVYSDGHLLGPHRDIVGCDLTCIVVVSDRASEGSPLWYWPSRARADIASLRADPLAGRKSVAGRPGEAIVILGSVVPHQLPQLPTGAHRVVAPLCFAASSG
jgi:hypothetical protein